MSGVDHREDAGSHRPGSVSVKPAVFGGPIVRWMGIRVPLPDADGPPSWRPHSPRCCEPGDPTSPNQVIQPGDFTRVPLTLAAHAQCMPWQVPG